MFSWHMPLDPGCPQVEHAFQIQIPEDVHDRETGELLYSKGEWIDDPMGASVMDDLMEDFEKRHRAKCTRCQEFGAANIEVV
jgi:hypothetical protein